MQHDGGDAAGQGRWQLWAAVVLALLLLWRTWVWIASAS